jgi:hypothetical protein
MSTPRTLMQLHAMPRGTDRFRAIAEYIDLGESKLREARKLRDDDIRTLAQHHGRAATARIAGVSLSTVNTVVGRP